MSASDAPAAPDSYGQSVGQTPTATRARTDDGPQDRLGGIVSVGDRLHRAIELHAEGMGERQAARVLAKETGLSVRRAADYLSAALRYLARSAERMPADERRAQLLERARKTFRLAMARERAYTVNNGGESYVETVADPDLRTALAAVEFELKLYPPAEEPSADTSVKVVIVEREQLRDEMARRRLKGDGG